MSPAENARSAIHKVCMIVGGSVVVAADDFCWFPPLIPLGTYRVTRHNVGSTRLSDEIRC